MVSSLCHGSSKCQKGFLDKTCKIRSQTEKVNITIEFYIFEIVLVPNYSLNWHFEFLYEINPKRVFLICRRKQLKLPMYSIYLS